MTATETPAVFSEEQAIRHLAEESWTRRGNSLVSRDSFSLEAVNQYLESLHPETRDAIKLRSEPSRTGGTLSDSRKMLLDARDAERFFAEHSLNLSVHEEQLAGSRKM